MNLLGLYKHYAHVERVVVPIFCSGTARGSANRLESRFPSKGQVPDPTGELLSALADLQRLPRKAKVCKPRQCRADAAGFSGCRNPARLTGFEDGGTKYPNEIKKSLGNAGLLCLFVSF